jgi:hypothetical protein
VIAKLGAGVMLGATSEVSKKQIWLCSRDLLNTNEANIR